MRGVPGFFIRPKVVLIDERPDRHVRRRSVGENVDQRLKTAKRGRRAPTILAGMPAYVRRPTLTLFEGAEGDSCSCRVALTRPFPI